MGTLAVIATLAQEASFVQRIKSAMTISALQIAGEAVAGMTTTVYGKRQRLAYEVLNAPDQYVYRFAWAVASNTTVSNGVGTPVAISSSTAANPSVITTAAAHGYSTGDQVLITGHATNTAVNGCWTITVLTTTTLSVPVLGVGAGGATGSVSKQPIDSDVQFTINSVWDDIAGRTATD